MARHFVLAAAWTRLPIYGSTHGGPPPGWGAHTTLKPTPGILNPIACIMMQLGVKSIPGQQGEVVNRCCEQGPLLLGMGHGQVVTGGLLDGPARAPALARLALAIGAAPAAGAGSTR